MPNRPGNDDRNIATGGQGQNGAQNGSAQTRTRSNRGFASMDRDKQKEIASKGGKAAHAKGTAHEFDSGEARDAGRKGGVAVSRNREHMAAIGRRGGEARGHSRSRVASQGSTAEGNNQNPRGSMNTDRQVAIDNQSDGVTSNNPANRGNSSSIGGERRPDNNRRESLGNR
ncbi:MAG TPA: KGG domain-containing protein [Gemmatimonadaceae bacterium]|nr:KGG domain-containing protein [Gemmatimonadaceae bacterium]